MLLKRLLTAFAAVSLLPAAAQMTVEEHLADFDFAVRQVEENYAGYPARMKTAQDEYRQLKARLAEEVARKGRPGYDAAGELFGWFGDFHLRTAMASALKYQRPRADYGEMEYAPRNTATYVDGQTYLIRVASFDADAEQLAWIEMAAQCFASSGCENLVIDLRGNSGGRDTAYEPLLKLVYERPGLTDGVVLRVSEDHVAYLRREADARGDASLAALADRMAAADTEFIPMNDGTKRPVVLYERIEPQPRKTAILIDGRVASSAEQFLLDARACSSRVRVYGRDNTLGCLDFSNVLRVDLPNSGITCWVPMTCSCRVPEGRGIDADGIAPDVRIPLPLPEQLTDNVDTWVCWAANDLKGEVSAKKNRKRN